jgi:phosphopantothenoylcysteine decarboxylase/phosphopantothenate--cysteine ligase
LYGLEADGDGPFLVGFAAESHDVEERGKAKRARKDAHMLIANQIGGDTSAFAADSARVCIITPGSSTWTERAPKGELSRVIWQAIVTKLAEAEET